MVKDRNESTTVILREFNCELIERLKKFTGEKTSTKAIEIVCTKYLGLEELGDKQTGEIIKLEVKLKRISELYKQAKETSNELQDLILG